VAAFAAMHGPDLLYLIRDLWPWGKPMRRREFIALLGSGVAGWPIAARAQQPAMPVVGFLGGADPAGYRAQLQALRLGLGDHGYVAGAICDFELRERGFEVPIDRGFEVQFRTFIPPLCQRP
jgi:hypothetical protein